MENKSSFSSVQRWGNSLAVRIPASLARTLHFDLGTAIELIAQDDGVMIKQSGERKLSLDQRLDLFDPELHGGEIMASKPIGKEKL